MRKLAILTAAVMASTIAQAADLRIPRAAPIAPAPVFSWTGFYTGLTAGYGWASIDHDVTLDNFNRAAVTTDTRGFIGGGYAGYNYQLNNWLVLGAETDISWADVKGSADTSGKIATVPYAATVDSRLRWLGSTRAKLGFVPLQSWMIYATGGVAYGSVEDSVSVCLGCSSIASSFATTATTSSVKAGWIAGGGVEAAVWSNLLARVEVLHYDLGTIPLFSGIKSKHDGNLMRAGVAWRW